MLQETTPLTGALRVHAVGSAQTPAQFQLLNSRRGTTMSVRKESIPGFAHDVLFSPFTNQGLRFSREIIISLRSH